MEWILWFFALTGHLGLWCIAYNRMHATAWPRTSRKFSEKIIFLIVLIPLVYVVTTVVSWYRLGVYPGLAELIESSKPFAVRNAGLAYVFFCAAAGSLFILIWSVRKIAFRLPPCVTQHYSRRVAMNFPKSNSLLHGFGPKFLGRIPGNQVLQATTEELTLTLDVPPELDNLRICQLSDTHFTGQIDVAWYQSIVQRANEFQPHLIVVTGDLVDKPKCLDWLDSTFGQLQAEYGMYYVLGNHDRRIEDIQKYRQQLQGIGLIQAAGRWHSVDVRGVKIQITGNELPWYAGAETLPTHPTVGRPGLKILLSHSPDQIGWAKPYEFDLMFAGHTHGGQIALPLIGPIVAPSKYGVLYASGTFQIGKTLMHVSRGIAGDEPIRFNCPPELGLFTIRSTATASLD